MVEVVFAGALTLITINHQHRPLPHHTLQMSVIPPEWRRTDSGATMALARPGKIKLEFAAALDGTQAAAGGFGNRKFDWDNKIILHLNADEFMEQLLWAANPTDTPPPRIIHDSNKGRAYVLVVVLGSLLWFGVQHVSSGLYNTNHMHRVYAHVLQQLQYNRTNPPPTSNHTNDIPHMHITHPITPTQSNTHTQW